MASSSQQWDALDKHEFAQYVLEENGSYFPSLLVMKENEQYVETLATVKLRINQLQNQHTSDLEKLYQHQAEQYLDDALDRYLQYDDLVAAKESQQPLRPNDFPARLEMMYRSSHMPISAAFNRAVTQIRTAHLQALQPLLDKRAELETHDEDTRRRRDAMFPKSITEYRSIWNKDVQVRIARFLTSDKGQQERTMSEFGWAWRQVQPLMDVYNSNAEFKGEVQARVKDVDVRDPRRKPSVMQLGV